MFGLFGNGMNLKSLFKGIRSYECYKDFPDAVIVISYSQNVRFWNKRAKKIFGYTENEILGKNIGLIFSDDSEKIGTVLGKDKPIIFSARTKEDKEIFVEISCVDIKENEDILICARDVSKNQKILEKLLLEYENSHKIIKNKSSFIADLSNDLRTPLHSIIGFSQALIDGLGGDLNEKQMKYVTIIDKNSNSLLALLSNVLDLSKIEAGKMEFNFKHFDVIQLIHAVLEQMTAQLKDKKIELSSDLTDVVKRNIFSDENMLRQVLLNILNNAVKFTESGSVSLKVMHPDLEFLDYQRIEVPPEYTDKSYLMFSVTDTGIGIAENELNNIFDEFRTVDKNISKKYGGTGLSLAITRKLLSELGGIIWVESEQTQGSTFSFIIPVERPKPTEANGNDI